MMSIDLAVGAPISMIPELCSLGQVELCFAHLMLDGGSTIYRSYYRDARATGRCVILDNGIMEQGFASDSVDLLRLTADLRPDFVTPPEVLHDAMETWRHAQTFAAKFASSNASETSRILGVVHGASFDDWRRCFDRIMVLPWVARIGIPYDIQFDVVSATTGCASQLQQLVIRRTEICEWVSRVYPDVEIHLFGLAHPTELLTQSCHSFIKSLDTSLPVMAAARGIRYAKTDCGPYEKTRLDLNLPYNAATVELARHNLNIVMTCWLAGKG